MAMRCLWLTCVDPEPEHSGQYIYSGRLIAALAQTGAEVAVVCAARAGTAAMQDGEAGLRWYRLPLRRRPRWASALSPLPHVAFKSVCPALRAAFRSRLRQERWDAVVIDGLFVGWGSQVIENALPGPDRPRLVYVSHNHEETTRALMARNFRGGRLQKLLLVNDARKARKLERRLARTADLVTAITQEDKLLYAALRGIRPTIVLPPGYRGRRLSERRIGAQTPRRAILVGSFDWMAKRMNLAEFLAVADQPFRAAGVELQIVGSGCSRFLEEMRRLGRHATFTGSVESILPYLDQARIALVPERTGGGFKLKLLDYVFNRVPVAALDQAVAGVPLVAGESALLFPNQEALVEGVLRAIDDIPLLNRLQEAAFAACADRFDWEERGRRLRDAIEAL